MKMSDAASIQATDTDLVHGSCQSASPVSGTPCSDARLYARFLEQDDRSALEELIRRWHGFAYRIASVICRNVSLAEEAVQNAFTEMLVRKSRFEEREGGSFRSWLGRIVTSNALMALRTERRAWRRRTVDPHDFAVSKNIERRQRPPVTFSIDLAQALDAIDARFRTPVLMHYLQGMGQREVALALGTSQQAISKRIGRGLELLRQQMN